MNNNTLQTSDGISLRYAYARRSREYPWIALIIPFGLETVMAGAFFDFFQTHYNLCTWECRCILEDSTRDYSVAELSIDRHVDDLFAVLSALEIEEAILVGYCSGAGIALAAMNRAPGRFSELILAHGEYTLLNDTACATQFAQEVDELLTLAASSDERARVVYDKLRTERFDGAHRPPGLARPFSELRFLKRYARNYLAYKAAKFEELAAGVSGNALLLAGGRDLQVNPESSRRIQCRMHNARLLVDPQANHYGVLIPNSDTMITIWNYLCENAHARLGGSVYSQSL